MIGNWHIFIRFVLFITVGYLPDEMFIDLLNYWNTAECMMQIDLNSRWKNESITFSFLALFGNVNTLWQNCNNRHNELSSYDEKCRAFQLDHCNESKMWEVSCVRSYCYCCCHILCVNLFFFFNYKMGGEVEKKTIADKTIEHFLSAVVIKEKKQQLLYLDLEVLFRSSWFFLVSFALHVQCTLYTVEVCACQSLQVILRVCWYTQFHYTWCRDYRFTSLKAWYIPGINHHLPVHQLLCRGLFCFCLPHCV